jgi:glycosyltransferase involved in cell wall biosynthesis
MSRASLQGEGVRAGVVPADTATRVPKACIVATLGPPHDGPWWRSDVGIGLGACTLDYERLVYRRKSSQDIGVLELPAVMLKLLVHLLRWRRSGYSHVVTFECDLVGLSIAFWQSLTGMRRPRHVIAQFIMREAEPTLRSRAKYALMRFLFRSVHRVVVSARSEVAYYGQAFGWPAGKAAFVAMHTDPGLLDRPAIDEGDYYLAAGRSFRDYDTLLRAVSGTDVALTIVGGRGAAQRYAGIPNVTALENIPPAELIGLMQRARAIVVPLHDRAISIGQSVILQAMALGKAVVATRTAGTVDYVTHLQDGLLVDPGDPEGLRDALVRLGDPTLRRALGARARSRVAAGLLPRHYAASMRRVVGE